MSSNSNTIAAASGVAFRLKSGQTLKVIDPMGGQVADLFCVAADRLTETFSSGCSIDYNETIYLTTGHTLYSCLGFPMLEIVEDTVGSHDVLLAPCSDAMFSRFHGDLNHASCHGNLSNVLRKFEVTPDAIASTFNVFMHVRIEANGQIKIHRPKSTPGDYIAFRALRDLIVGLTACSDEQTNGGILKPITFELGSSH